ncbi:nicotinate phosphoribosyltransferase [Candidatus Albibeggiatoa sp. nov. NOAA]|uniref:nicotinate phosphoribosyltransferase n=1 Tax=Candidatus Albibeggiatoa sp. nov. NOAA TaxID=3162724 RepID=UPI003304CCC1|nr:nicotinate phosphoribosyltransferase [Thiotrichaceae bacterium]
MSNLTHLYQHSLSLLTDLYQLTMAYGYWKSGRTNHQSVFHLFFRTLPFNGHYAVAAGLQTAVEYLQQFHITTDDIAYLQTLTGNDGKPLFEPAFLDYLTQLKFDCDVDAIPEGTVVFPHEPLLRIKGSLIQTQLLETALLNIINFQTLIATKSARVCQAAQGDSVLEFGLRRAQGIDGALSASRAAYIGGCTATSNVLAGKLFGIPVKGTHAHSWIMSFDDELEAFKVYAQAMPNNCIFLVDTYDSIHGIELAIQMGHELRQQGHEMVGIRLDSGNMNRLSQKARQMLDQADFPNAKIVASNDLNEFVISELKQNGAKIDIWGVGTQLATAYNQPALGGVYKLSAIRENDSQAWQYRLKLSEQTVKTSNPGIIQVKRYRDENQQFMLDMLYDEPSTIQNPVQYVPIGETEPVALDSTWVGQDLLQPIMRQGQLVTDLPDLVQIQQRTQSQLQQLPNSHALQAITHYPIGLELGYYELKQRLMQQLRRK